jgi:hypothetical protein
MAKKEVTPSFGDFTAENLLISSEEIEEKDEQEEEQEEQQEEEEKKPKSKKKTIKAKEEEETSQEEEEEEKEGEESKDKDKKKVKAEEEPKEKPETPDEDREVDDADRFFAEVEKLTGTELDVDYGETDPLSPQGVALREAAVKEDALDGFLAEIEEKFPQAFRALKHAYNGGDIAELFTKTLTRDYSTVKIEEKDEDLAKEILKEYYKSKGVKSDAKITKLIETDEDSETGIVGEAKTALEEMKAEQAEANNKVVEEQEKRASESKKRDQVLIAAVDEVLEARQLNSFKISDRAEATQFKQFVLGNIRRAPDGKYDLVTPVDQSNLEKVLQYQYFQFKKGDLSKIIQQKATTENVKRLKLRLKNEQAVIKKNTDQEDKGTQARTLKTYTVD